MVQSIKVQIYDLAEWIWTELSLNVLERQALEPWSKG